MAAGQLAVQDYLSRVQAAARDPGQYAALQAQGVLPGYDPLAQGSKARKQNSEGGDTGSPFQHLKLPSDTESQHTDGEAPLNLSMKSESDPPVSLSVKRKDAAEK